MSKVISVREPTYELLSETTAQFMELSKNPTSLSSTVEFVLSIAYSLMQKVQVESERNSSFREELKNAIRDKDSETVTRLVLETVSKP